MNAQLLWPVPTLPSRGAWDLHGTSAFKVEVRAIVDFARKSVQRIPMIYGDITELILSDVGLGLDHMMSGVFVTWRNSVRKPLYGFVLLLDDEQSSFSSAAPPLRHQFPRSSVPRLPSPCRGRVEYLVLPNCVDTGSRGKPGILRQNRDILPNLLVSRH